MDTWVVLATVNKDAEVENRCVDMRARGRGGGMNWETGIDIYTFYLVQFSGSVVSDSLRPHES